MSSESEPVRERKPKKQKPERVNQLFPENPWVDDVGLLKDRDRHFEVDRLVTCNCLNCQSKAATHIRESFEEAFGKKVPEPVVPVIYSLYELYREDWKIAKRKIPPEDDEITIFEKK